MRSNSRTVHSGVERFPFPFQRRRKRTSPKAGTPPQGEPPEEHHENPFNLEATQRVEKLVMILGGVLPGRKNFTLYVHDYTKILRKSTAMDLNSGDKGRQGIVSDL